MSNTSNELQKLFPDLTLAFYIYPPLEMKKFSILTESNPSFFTLFFLSLVGAVLRKVDFALIIQIISAYGFFPYILRS